MSQIRVNEVVSENSTGSPRFPNGLVVSGVATFSGDVDVLNVDAVGVITANSGIEVVGFVTAKEGSTVSYYGDGSNLTGLPAGGIGIQSGGITIGTGITQLNFVGSGNTITLVGGDTVEISISGGVSGGAPGTVVANPFLTNDNVGYHPTELTGDGSVVTNSTLQTRRWYKNDVVIAGAAGTQVNTTGVGTYKYEERWTADSSGELLLASAETDIFELGITRPTITSPTNGATNVSPFNLDGTQTIFPTSSVPGISTGAITAWGDANWTLATDSLFTIDTQTSSLAINDDTIGQIGPIFTYAAGTTYYMRVRYNATSPTGQDPSSFSPTISFITSADTYSIAGPSAVDEGVTSTFTVTTSNVKNGDTLYWNTTSATDFNPAVGSFAVNNNSGTFDVTTEEDNLLEGAETFQLRLYTDSGRTNLVYTSASITINDTSRGVGQVAYTTPGTYSWTAPSYVTSVCVVCVGGGGPGGWDEVAGGSGGGLGYKNNISVTGGQSYTVVVGAGGQINTNSIVPGPPTVNHDGTSGGDSYFIDATTVKGGGASCLIRNNGGNNQAGTPGDYVGDGGGNGGLGGASTEQQFLNDGGGSSGGGGAGGYSGDGGKGADADWNNEGNSGTGPDDGSGGGGGGGYAEGGTDREWYGAGGGGVGILGEGANGAKGTTSNSGGRGGSGGANGTDRAVNNVNTVPGGNFGGGGGAGDDSSETGDGAGGAVRIIWGLGRAFPSTNTTDQS